MRPPLVALVVAYGNADELSLALSPIANAVPIVVVDNSSDPEVKRAAADFGAAYFDPGENRGFAAGVNAGLRLLPSGADVLLLNPDAVVSEESARRLHASLYERGANVSVAAPSLVDADGSREQRVAWPFPSPRRMWREAFLRSAGPAGDQFVVGAVALIRRTAIDAVGGFDERFFLYAEETDWQRRAAFAGWTSAQCDDVEAIHRGAGTSESLSRREALFHAGTETYVRKWHGGVGWEMYRTAAILGALARAAFGKQASRRTARARFVLYVRGPRNSAGLSAT
jgi:GT2 family glycosyltransferase